MKAEDKELLLKDLCARLPYGVIVKLDDKFKFNKGDRVLVKELLDLYCIEGIKPYLRLMSSMTEEEKEELLNLLFDKEDKYFYIDKEGLIDGKISNLMKEGLNYPAFCPINVEIYTDYLNAHHFDWRFLRQDFNISSDR